jgi:hypothetical protein
MVFATVVFWRTSPVGVVAISLMCGGDGASQAPAGMLLRCRGALCVLCACAALMFRLP